MSEKRFFILKDDEYDDVLPCIRDKQRELKDIYGHYKYDDINQICDLLNALHEENERLHDEIFRLRTMIAYDRTVGDKDE